MFIVVSIHRPPTHLYLSPPFIQYTTEAAREAERSSAGLESALPPCA